MSSHSTLAFAAPALNERARSVLRRAWRSVVVTTVVAAGVLAVPGRADAGPVPRLLPSRLPAGYIVEETTDNQEPSSTLSFVSYFRNEANDRAIAIFAEPITASDWKDLAKQFTKDKYAKTTIKGKQAFVLPQGQNRQIVWFNQNRLFTSYANGLDLKSNRAVDSSIKITSASSSSFRVAAAPPGFSEVYTGPVAALRGSYSRVLYVIDPQGAHDHLIVEVTGIDRRYLDLYLLSPLVAPATQSTVNGKPAYKTVQERYATYWWEEQPGLLVEVTSTVMSDAALLDVANSVVPVDEATFASLRSQAEASSVTPEVASPELVGAGMVGSDPWTAQLAVQQNCLVFTIGGLQSQACLKSPNALGWTTVLPKEKSFVVGVAAANITTVVVKSNGVEVSRSPVSSVVGQATLRSFVAVAPNDGSIVTVSGLDATGAEVQAAIPAWT